MRHRIIVIMVCILSIHNGYAQTEKASNHVGVSGVPIYDLFNFYPDNKIAGSAIYIDYGIFVRNNLSFGINIYYANVSNEYDTEAADFHKEKQVIALTGLNSNLRYNHSLSEKILIFASISLGFGNYRIETTDLSTSLIVDNSNESVALLMTGIGLNYFVAKNFALELNVPYVFVNRFSKEPYVENVHAIVPSIGIRYYWNTNE